MGFNACAPWWLRWAFSRLPLTWPWPPTMEAPRQDEQSTFAGDLCSLNCCDDEVGSHRLFGRTNWDIRAAEIYRSESCDVNPIIVPIGGTSNLSGIEMLEGFGCYSSFTS